MINLDPLYSELCTAGRHDAVHAYLERNECDVDPSFLGFTDIYQHLAEIVPKENTVIDFGCAYGFQAWYFRHHAKYIGIDAHVSEFFTLPELKNCEFVTMCGQDWLDANRKTPLIDHFAICSYVPDPSLRAMVKTRLRNCFVFYP